MKSTSKQLSIIAYYLSEYDIKAVEALGYKTRSSAFKGISLILERPNDYLKLRRDEFDALPDSSSYRNGWKNRPPAADVITMATYLKKFSFEELTNIVKGIISNDKNTNEIVLDSIDKDQEINIENIINYQDSSANILEKLSLTHIRKYDINIIHQLKKLYNGKCQICGIDTKTKYGTDICEAHHIQYFSESCNNDADNIIVVCPNHHRMIHKLNMSFDKDKLEFYSKDNIKLHISQNYHI